MANAWDAYVTNLMQYPKINFASIHGPDGSVYACHPSVKTTQPEISKVVSAVKANSRDFPSFHLGGNKFLTIRIDEDTIDGKFLNNAVCIAVCDKVVIVGGHLADKEEKSDQSLGATVNKAVSAVKDYLKKNGM